MDHSVHSVITQLGLDSEPQDTMKALEYLSYVGWSRNKTFLNSFLKLNGLPALIDLLRIKDSVTSFDATAETTPSITIQLHHSKNGPTVINESWHSVLSGYAGEVLSRMLHMELSLVAPIVDQECWLLPRLLSMLSSGSDFEKYGALMSLEVFLHVGEIRERLIKDGNLVELVVDLIRASCQAPHRNSLTSGDRIFGQIRWKLALWRTCFDVITLMTAMPGVDFAGSEPIPLRADWKLLVKDGQLVSSIFEIVRFCHDVIPKKEDERFGTVFSGPGVFKGSAIKVNDLGVIIRTALFLLHRLGIHDEDSKQYIMRNGTAVGHLKRLGAYMDHGEREEIIQFLVFMGVGSPVAQIKSDSLLHLLKSEKPSECLRALKMLLHADHLVDCEQLGMLMESGGVQALLRLLRAGSEMPNDYHKKVGRCLIQRNPLRDAISLPQNTIWRNVCRAFAAAVLGRLCRYGQTSVLAQFSTETWPVETMIQMLKIGTDIEKWGASLGLSGYLKSTHCFNPNPCHELSSLFCAETFVYTLVKLLSIRSDVSRSTFLNSSASDLQWLFETWNSVAKILDAGFIRSQQDVKSEVFSRCHQAGVIQSLFAALSFIASLHNIKPAKSVMAMYTSNDRFDNQHRYDNDSTLPNLVYNLISLVANMCEFDAASRAIVLWEDHVATLKLFGRFASTDVQAAVKRIATALIVNSSTHVSRVKEVNDPKPKLLDLKLLLKTIGFAEAVWPDTLNRPPIYDALMWQENYTLDKETRNAHVERDVEPYAIIKICGNEACTNKETRRNQFTACQACNDIKWYCSKACQQTTPQKPQEDSPQLPYASSTIGQSSPNPSPLVTRTKRRFLDMATTAQGTLASLALGTPKKAESSTIGGMSRPQLSRSLTMPVGSALNEVYSVEYDSQPLSFGFTTTESPPNKMRRVEGSLPTERAASNAIKFEASISGERNLLPHHTSNKDAIKRISSETLTKLLEGQFNHVIDGFDVIDCRFKYEFEGGHIQGARNVNTHDELNGLYFPQGLETHKPESTRRVLVFHCEYSSHRGPRMALYLRSQDRVANGANYPSLHYPEIYVLEGGYREFYARHKDYCDPQGYVEMKDTKFKVDLKQERIKRGGSFMRQSVSFIETDTKMYGLPRPSKSFIIPPTSSSQPRSPETDTILKPTANFKVPMPPLESTHIFKSKKAGLANVKSWSRRF